MRIGETSKYFGLTMQVFRLEQRTSTGGHNKPNCHRTSTSVDRHAGHHAVMDGECHHQLQTVSRCHSSTLADLLLVIWR